jgi:hypothetical protein
MTESLSHWLRLREPADAMARAEELTRAVSGTVDAQKPVHVLDLATGTGSNIRYLVPRLPRHQRWLAVDKDAVLLAELPNRMASWGAAQGYDVRPTATGCAIRGASLDCLIDTRHLDLSGVDEGTIFARRQLVTASALLDLVSAQWLRALAGQCRSAGASALFTITYNGRSSCSPAEPEDEIIRGLMNRHQKRDKGLGGPAEGPDATDWAELVFSQAGFYVRREASDWTLGPNEDDLQRELIEGWAQAATDVAPELALKIEQWRVRRLEHVKAGRSKIVVCHEDMAALAS